MTGCPAHRVYNSNCSVCHRKKDEQWNSTFSGLDQTVQDNTRMTLDIAEVRDRIDSTPDFGGGFDGGESGGGGASGGWD
jgi:uncharacterized membrane protein YgcG